MVDPIKTQEALIASEMRFWVVAQSAADAIISADPEGNIIFWNTAAQRIFGYAEDEVLGKSLTMLMPPEYRDRHNAGMQHYKDTGEPRAIGTTVELHGVRQDGTVFPIELSLSTWNTLEGVYFNGIIRDITERKDAEATLRTYAEELEARNQELYTYDRTIAHDLKSPLGGISTYVDLLQLKNRHELSDKGKEYLDRVEKAADQMAEMIDHLLWLATIRDAVEAAVPVHMRPVLDNVKARFHHHFEQDHLSLEIVEPLPSVLGHATWLEEVFANLVSNAIKYKGKDNIAPQIIIRGNMEEDGKFIRYEVQDNGLGIPKETQARLFEAFTRTHMDQAAGFGLGLSIVHRIITRLNGRVGVHSTLGKGSIFWFTLPAV